MYDDNYLNTENTNNAYVYKEDMYKQEYVGGGNGEPKPKKPKKEKKQGTLGSKLVVGLLMAILFGGFAGISFLAVQGADSFFAERVQSKESEEGLLGQALTEKEIEETAEILQRTNDTTTVVTDVTNVVSEVMPSVVSITNKMIYKQEDFFGRTVESEQPSSGSGIIVGENETELLIVTNYHVVADANELQVQFVDGESVVAQIKGTDVTMDLAVIAISLEDLSQETKNSISIAKLGESDSLKVGEPAIAIGNALGYGQSVTTGVISALNREVEMQSLSTSGATTMHTLIQTDAAINPGNSGGALLNVKGEVVGINSNKIGGSVIEGMGYAIPISAAIPIIEDLMVKETRVLVPESKKGYLGISGVNVTTDVASVYGMPEGVYIAQVYEGTGAAKAGLVKGDIITSLDGNAIQSMEALTDLLSYYEMGTTVEIIIMQGSPQGYQEKTISLTLSGKFE